LKVTRLPEFERDLKRFRKRFSTIDEDLALLLEIQWLYHSGKLDNQGTVRIQGVGSEDVYIFKVRKFACKSLKGKASRTGLRLIYAYWPEEDRIELVEIYYKQDKEIEDRERIRKHYP